MPKAALPTPDEIVGEIEARRDEIRALKKLLRASVALRDTEEARSRRPTAARTREEVDRGDR